MKRSRRVRLRFGMILLLLVGASFPATGQDTPSLDPTPETPPARIDLGIDPATYFEVGSIDAEVQPAAAVETPASPSGDATADTPPTARAEVERVARTVGLFAAVSLAPVAVLMATAFVRINIVLLLLRQAIGSPQVPGNQVLTVLSLLLTAMVMAPAAELVYRDAIRPYADGELPVEEAWQVGSGPIKAFMLDQIHRTGHAHYLDALSVHAQAADDSPTVASETEENASPAASPPLRVVAPAFLISELTTALWIGFLIYLPFLVVDLVVSAVLAATGLIMLPPTQVALPLKLALFVLVDGWWLVADGLLRTFALGSSGAVG
ncbi:flagellar type III secretion system pore protein FliP [Tautonia marina]|uniref:flagellar type III secretion system pore protein FliP n=1 Tax=Tautonia marina TaxID=2653855 RepID=UPI0012606F0D|nr:flagellar type III secretion system pore protein FliP [Tautonia marina]